MSKDKTNHYVISVMVADRVGILKDITSAVDELGANIDGISQTVLQGFFTVIITASFGRAMTAEHVRSTIQDNLASDKGAVSVLPCAQKSAPAPHTGGDRYIVTITGHDRPGILKSVTSFFAAKAINIEDWFVEFHGSEVVHVGEVSVPASLDIKQAKDEFGTLLGRFKLKTSLQHENIFKVTNEIGAIKPILGDK